MRMGSNSCWNFEKDIRISLDFSLFNWTLIHRDHCITVWRCALLSSPFATVSEMVVSSTYLHKRAISTTRSLITIQKSEIPSLVPWGTPNGTDPLSDTHPTPSLILWDLFDKDMVHRGCPWTRPMFCTFLWRMLRHPGVWLVLNSDFSICAFVFPHVIFTLSYLRACDIALHHMH